MEICTGILRFIRHRQFHTQIFPGSAKHEGSNQRVATLRL